MSTQNKKTTPGFTLIELLTVIAIIGILAAIIIPVTGQVRTSAKKTQTRTMFSQWIQATEMFKTEYGFYPVIGSDGTDKTLISTKGDTIEFVRTLTAKEPDGQDTTAANLKVTGNKKRQSFFKLSPNDLLLVGSDYFLVDAFGNTEFGFVVDRNGDGVVKGDENGSVNATIAEVKSKDYPANDPFKPTVSTTAADDDEKDIPSTGVRAGVLIYSAGKDAERSNVVMSWK